MENLEKHFDEKLKNEFERFSDGKWHKTTGMDTATFTCPKNKEPWQEWKDRYPTAYKLALDDFFDEVHPY